MLAPASVFIASDHRGFALKKSLVRAFPELQDLGPHSFDPEDDYNDAALAVARAVRETSGARGILLCGSAIGVSIQANRIKGIRAAVALDPRAVRLSRQHNDANVLCLSADRLSTRRAERLIKLFLDTPFSGEERHVRRIKRLDEETK
ncbi:RpiB/LacA/LacB family sugar-phosphate isomerase [Candidatus Saccharibacteria bacterium]|nr:RpiB/LacA/LacB family sugar-phosphate isomerase [Candidatus Saccharibacteria bacterium]